MQYYGLTSKECNTYEYNPLTQVFNLDSRHSEIDDRTQAERWVKKLNFKKIVEPLIIKPIINPFNIKEVSKPTKKHIQLLKKWDLVGDSVGDSVWESVRDLVGD